MLKPYQFHKVSLTLNLDRVIATTRQSTHFPRVFSHAVTWWGVTAGKVGWPSVCTAYTCWDPHTALPCALLRSSPHALFSNRDFAICQSNQEARGSESGMEHAFGAVEEFSVLWAWGRERVWVQSPYLLLPPKKGFLWLRFRGGWKGEVVKILVWLWLADQRITDAPKFTQETCELAGVRRAVQIQAGENEERGMEAWEVHRICKTPRVQSQRMYGWGGKRIWWLHKTVNANLLWKYREDYLSFSTCLSKFSHQ